MSAITELQMYPGHFPPNEIDPVTHGRFGAGLLVVLRGKNVLYRCPAWGGPSLATPDRYGIIATPTPAGVYILMKPAPYVTRTWKFGGIRWGASIKRDLSDQTDVLYRRSSGLPGKERWGSTKREFSLSYDEICSYHQELYGSYKLPTTWLFNPFGPLAARFFRDTNGNGKLDKSESLAGEMIHTTAENEAQLATGGVVTPGNSHGCVHMTPKDRDALFGMHVLKAGTRLTIHPYSERYGGGP